MTPEQERAEARIDKAKLLEWLDERLFDGELPPPSGIYHAYTDLKSSIESGTFDINSLDREEQLMGYIDTVESDLKYFTEKVAEQDKEIQRLREFAKTVLRHGFEGDLCGADIQDLGVKHGLLNEEIYDPEKHGDDFGSNFEPGDTIYMFSDALKPKDPESVEAEG